MPLLLRILLYLLVAAAPYGLMVAVHRTSAQHGQRHGYHYLQQPTLYPAQQHERLCTWACHNHTAFCRSHHVQLLRPWLAYTDVAYFGLINALKRTGNYATANIALLTAGWPLLLWMLLIANVELWLALRRKKHQNT